MLVGSFGKGAFEHSYASAFKEIKCEVLTFDIIAAEMRNCRLGKFGQLFNKFVPVEPWIRKANRELILEVRKFKPEIIIVFGQNRVLTGAIAQIKAMLPIKIVFIWQDTMLNLSSHLINTLCLYDLICTYSKSNIIPLELLGGRRVVWLPLCAEPHFNLNTIDKFKCDISFIGQWRPEREAVIAEILNQFPHLTIKIWGTDWKRRSHNQKIINAWQGRPLYGIEFEQAILSSKLNLNIIDDTNFPAANLRFFEISCAKGLQLSSLCPEMEDEFKNGVSMFYFNTNEELVRIINYLLKNELLIEKVRLSAYEKVIEAHTYKQRAIQIYDLLNLTSSDLNSNS